MTRYLGRDEILNTKKNEFNSATIFPVWHELSRLRCGQINVADIHRRQETGKYTVALCLKRLHYCCIHMKTFIIVWLLRNLTLANCVSVMTKMLPLFNFTISCRGRRAWKMSRCVGALARSRFWLVESTVFGDHASLRLHWEFSLKFNLFN